MDETRIEDLLGAFLKVHLTRVEEILWIADSLGTL